MPIIFVDLFGSDCLTLPGFALALGGEDIFMCWNAFSQPLDGPLHMWSQAEETEGTNLEMFGRTSK